MCISENNNSCLGESVIDYYSINTNFEVLTQKLFALNQTKEQVLKAIYFDDNFIKTKLTKARIEAEKILLITGELLIFI